MAATTEVRRNTEGWGLDPIHREIVAGVGCRPTDLEAKERIWAASIGAKRTATRGDLVAGTLITDQHPWAEARRMAEIAIADALGTRLQPIVIDLDAEARGAVAAWDRACVDAAARLIETATTDDRVLAAALEDLVFETTAEQLARWADTPEGQVVAIDLHHRRRHAHAVSAAFVWFHRVAFVTCEGDEPGSVEAAWFRDACNVGWADKEILARWWRADDDAVRVAGSVVAAHLNEVLGGPKRALSHLVAAMRCGDDQAIGTSILVQSAHWVRERRGRIDL